MEISAIRLVYFSATYTTRKIVRLIAKQMETETTEYDITQKIPENDILLGANELFVIGVPVYAGRISANALQAITKFKGNNTPAIIVCVYGNRDYDDALLELKNTITENGCKVVSAGAFIAQHSIFPTVGTNRPDEEDIIQIKAFADKTAEHLQSITDIMAYPEVVVKGNVPYKTPGKIPLTPKASGKCDKCGICAKQCPVQAIPSDHPRRTDKEICISCGRCIVICPQKARHFSGLLYKIAGKKFTKANAARKEPAYFYAEKRG